MASKELQGSVLDSAKNARFARGLQCPRCGGNRQHRWGSFAGRQRYRCLGCSRTFSDLTGTPAAYLKKVELLPAYGRCMAKGFSVRRTARALEIDPATAFRWRHRLCRDLDRRRDMPNGWVELTTLRLIESQKGSRRPTRKPRRRGWAPWTSVRSTVCILIVADRLGRIASRCLAEPPARWVDVQALLAGATRPESLLAAEGRFGPVATYARRNGIRFRDVRWPTDDRPFDHLRTARAYGTRFVVWLERFRGVASRYLGNYLAWHRFVDRFERLAFDREVLRWPADGGPQFPRTEPEGTERVKGGRALGTDEAKRGAGAG